MDKMNCALDSGIAVAEVSESAIGFRIATPAAQVVDFGTRFSVMVDAANGSTHTQVYEGLVQVEHPSRGRIVNIKAGQMNSADQKQMSDATEGYEETTTKIYFDPELHSPSWSYHETCKDCYIGEARDNGKKVPRSETLLLVKKTRGGYSDRSAYLGFDLSGYDHDKIDQAELILHFAATNLGLASDVPDATFRVYGIEEGCEWTESSMLKKKFSSGHFRAPIDPKTHRNLGEFIMEQAVQNGEFRINTPELADFLRENARKAVTLMIMRNTMESKVTGLVHGFTSRRHPTLPDPTLAIRRPNPLE